MELEIISQNIHKRNSVKVYLEEFSKKKVKEHRDKKIERTLKEKQKIFQEESNLIISKGK